MRKKFDLFSRIFFIFFICLIGISGGLFAAGETGEGTAAFDTLELRDGELDSQLVLTYTVADTNMAGGNINLFWVAGWGSLTTNASAGDGYVYVSATSENNVGSVSIINDTQISLTVTALDIGETASIMLNGVTTSATAGSQDFTFTQAADSTVTSTADAIAALPNIYVWDSSNPVALMTTLPTPVILNNYNPETKTQIMLTTSYTGGQIIIAKPIGTPGANSTPNFADFSASTLNAGFVRIDATPGIWGTPTITANQVVIPIATAGAGNIGVFYYGTTYTAAVVSGGTFCDDCRMEIKSNAIAAAATETPIATTVYFDVWVPTPTVVITPITKGQGKVQYKCSGLNGSTKTFYDGSTKVGKGTTWNIGNALFYDNIGGLSIGSHTITMRMKWKDNDNDGVYRVVTSNADTYYNIGEFDFISSYPAITAAGYVTNEIISTTGGAGGAYQATTASASDQVFTAVKINNTVNSTWEVYVGGTQLTGGTLKGTYEGVSETGTVFENKAIYVPAGTWIKVSKTAGIAGDADVIVESFNVSDWSSVAPAK